jgi:hypothetical protein
MENHWRGSTTYPQDTGNVVSLASFLWRFGQIRNTTDMGFASHPNLTLRLPTLLLHLMLNLLSIDFRIPRKRIDSGYRIWPEYSIHSLAFLCRSLALIALTRYYEQTYEMSPNHWMNLAIVLAIVAVADIGFTFYGEKYKSGFACQLDAPNMVEFQATAGCLYGTRRYSIQ